MSNAEMRTAKRVWAHVLNMLRVHGVNGRLLFTVVDAAKEAEVSRATAKKYLDKAVGEGALSSWKLMNGRVFYTVEE